MPSPKKNRLLEIEKKLKGRQRKARKRLGKSKHRPMAARHKRGGRVRAQALDQGEPIELIYNETTESYEAGEMSYEPADEGEAEALDWDEEYEDEDEDEDEDEAEALDWDEDYEDKDEAQAFDVDEDDEAEAFEVEAFEEDESEDSDASDASYGSGSQAFSTADDEELPEDLDFSDDAARDYDQPSRALSDSDFAADLQAIINGEKTYDRDRGGVVDTRDDADEAELATAKSQTPAEEAPPAPEAEANPHEVFSQMSQHMPHNRIGSSPQLAQAKSQAAGGEAEAEERPHDVFDRMGRNMSYANAFDLGSISMEQRFEELDEAIDKEEEKIQARTNAIQKKNGADDQETSAPLALDDAALVDDLDQMHEAMADEGDEADEDNESASDEDESEAVESENEKAAPEMHEAMAAEEQSASDQSQRRPIAQQLGGELTVFHADPADHEGYGDLLDKIVSGKKYDKKIAKNFIREINVHRHAANKPQLKEDPSKLSATEAKSDEYDWDLKYDGRLIAKFAMVERGNKWYLTIDLPIDTVDLFPRELTPSKRMDPQVLRKPTPKEVKEVNELMNTVIAAVNLARTNPIHYYNRITDILEGGEYIDPNKKTGWKYKKDNIYKKSRSDQEYPQWGKKGLQDAQKFLKTLIHSRKKLEPLKKSKTIGKVQQRHADDLATYHLDAHDGDKERGRYIKTQYKGTFRENIHNGWGDTAEEIVIGWIIDDGWDDLQHRENLFSPDSRYIGVGVTADRAHKEKSWLVIGIADEAKK